MWRALRVLLLACILPLATAIPANASTPSDIPSVLALSALWSKVLQTPDAQNPFGSGGEQFTCIKLAPRVIAPFGPAAVPACTVNRGTTLVVTPWTFECSTFEGSTLPNLRTCAVSADEGITTTVTLDAKPVTTHEVETVLIPVVLPANNIFNASAGSKGSSVGHGWVAILKPMTPGEHTINVTASGPGGLSIDNITTITVR